MLIGGWIFSLTNGLGEMSERVYRIVIDNNSTTTITLAISILPNETNLFNKYVATRKIPDRSRSLEVSRWPILMPLVMSDSL